MNAFDADFFENAAVVINGKCVEYADGLIRLTGDVESATVTFATESATLELTLRNYTAPEKPVVPETEEGFSYRFFTGSATVEEILAANEIVSSYYSIVSVSDEKLVTIKGDELIAENYFDEVILTVSLSDGTEVEIALSNPAPVAAGETVVVEGVGSFSAKDEIPAGTVLTVDSNPMVPEGIVIPGSTMKSETVSDPVFFDVSLVGPDGKEIQTGASVTIATDIKLPQEDSKVTKVTGVKVYHIGEKGDVEELEGATYAIGEGKISSVSFTTDGFSLFAVTYTVEFVSAEVSVAWSWPGQGSYSIADILAEIGVEGTAESVALECIVDMGGNDKVLYLEEKEDGWYLVSEEAFQDTFELKIVVDGVTYTFTITDDPVDNHVTAEVYFLNTDGTRTTNAETESGNTLNARINLSNSSANSNEKAYVKVSLTGLGNYVTLNERFRPNEWDHITFRDMTTGTQYSIGVYYNPTDNSITYEVPGGATGIAALSFTTPNGITPDETTLRMTPSLVDSNFSLITPAANDVIGGPASGKWISDFNWDPIQKYVNNSKENTVVVTNDNGTPKINTWLHYDYSANSQNRAETGVRWTNTATISDNLTLPEHMSFTGSYTCNLTDGRIYINGASAPDNILFGLTLKPNMQCTALSITGNTIHYEITVTNPNRDGSTNELTAEMENISYITELNAAGITLDPAYISSGYYGEEIVNAVSVTETPNKGNDSVASQDQVKTKTKQDEGYSVEKNSTQDGQYVEAGATLEYTISVTNTGNATIAAADSVVYDTLPSAVYLTADVIDKLRDDYGDSITIDGNNITFRTGTLEPGETVSLVINATVRDSKTLEQWGYTNESAITNTAVYRGLSDYVASKLHAGTITSEKTSDKTNTTLRHGDTVNFTLTAKNETAYNYTGEVTLTDYLPKYLKVTFYDQSGADITTTVYNQTNHTYDPDNPQNGDPVCYVRDSSNNLVPARVVIDGDGRTTVVVTKADGLSANSQYNIVLTATYDESKVVGTVNDDGNIQYTNYVNVNNTQSHTDITVAVGKVDLDKYVSGASYHGSAATQPYSDETEVTYTIHVTNDSANPYTHDIVVTDVMPRGLVPMGLTVEGTTYNSWQDYVNRWGWYEKDATISDGNGGTQNVKVIQINNGLKLTWTIPNPDDYGNRVTERYITYKALVKTDELVNQSTGLQELENTVTAVGREDKEIIVVDVKGVEISKKIVGPNGELLDTIQIGPGSVVTYELTIENPNHLNTTVTGITDYLPHGGGTSVFPLSYWQFGTTVVVDETTTGKNEFHLNATPYANNDANYGRTYWFDTEHFLHFGDINITSSQERLVQRITLTYPDDPAVLHAMFVGTAWSGRQQKNRYKIDGMNPVEVDHTEVLNKKFYVQKSVIGLSAYKGYNYVAISSKDLFNQSDVEYVTYTVMVVNNGTGPIHINSLSDILPTELQFKGLAASDYNAGTNVYDSNQITTADQNNNPNYVCPSGYTAISGVTVTASQPSGNTVRFTLNGGAGVDLPEKTLLAFNIQCKWKNGVTLTDGQPITNTIQADLDSDAVLSRMPIATQKTHDDAIQNNGSCTVVSNDGTHQIAESSVTIHPSNVAVPGILKKAVAYQTQNNNNWSDWTALNDNTTNINSQSRVKWKITLYNAGAVPLDGGYTLSDSIYEHHSFGSVESFTINGSSKDVTASPFTPTTEKVGHYNKYTFTFPSGSDYAIPAGGKAELELVTTFTTGQYQGQLDNKAIFSPVQEWDANRVIRGQLEKNAEGTEYTGVSSMDYVNMLGDGATMAYKVVSEKNNPTNRAFGYDVATGRNYITVDDTDQLVTYTNHVQNLTNSTFKKFVMIDRMPEIGDTGVVNAHDQRGSEYSIGFADNLNLTLVLRNSEGTNSIQLTSEDYTLEFSDKTAYTTEDWDGTSAWSGSSANAKSFRLKLNASSLTAKINSLQNSSLSEAVFPSMWVLEVRYDGKLSADGTAGQYAWNSFGYHYTTAADENLSAEPPKAGVRLKPMPVLKKQVVDSHGVDQGIDTNVQFTFKFYSGSHTLDEVASLTPIWQTTLYQGQAVKLLAQKTVGGVTTGHFTEGQYYTVVEEPTAGYDLLGYEKDGLKQTTVGYCVFRYSNELNTTIVCQNQISGFAPEAEKVLYAAAPRTLQNQEFTFELLPLTNVDLNDLTQVEVIGNRLQQAQNDASGHVQFDTIEYSAAGTYYYLMREASGNDSTVVYDDTKYLVKVEVSQVGALFSAIGSYYKVTDSDENDPIKGIQALSANTVPTFINTESTQIQVEKVWAGEVTTGSATMVLYRSTTAPTDTFDVTVHATLSGGTPAASGAITVTYTGDGGDSGTITLNNAQGWTGRTVTLKRGEVYTFTFAGDSGNKVTNISPASVSGVADARTIDLTANAVAAGQYTVTFSVPQTIKDYNDGTITVTSPTNGTLTFAKDNWSDKSFTVDEEDDLSYTVSVDGKFITAVTTNNGSFSNITENKSVMLGNFTTAEKTRSVTVGVDWGANADKVASGNITVTFSGNGSTYTATLSGSSWSDSVTLPRLDSNGDEISYTAAGSSTVTATEGDFSFTYPGTLTGNSYTVTASYNPPSTEVYITILLNNVEGASSYQISDLKDMNDNAVSFYTTQPGTYNVGPLQSGTTYKIYIVAKDANYQLIDILVTNASSQGSGNYQFTAENNKTITIQKLTSSNAPKDYLVLINNAESAISINYFDSNKNGSMSWAANGATVAANNSKVLGSVNENNVTYRMYVNNLDQYDVTFQSGSGTAYSTYIEYTPNGETATKILFSNKSGSALISPTLTASLPSTFLRIADGSGNDVQMRGAAQTFADTTLPEPGSGTPFTVIQAKDLPAGAVVASDITGYEQTITGDRSYTWTNLPLFDEAGNRIYYYVVEKTASANASSMSVRYGYTYNTPGDPASGISKVTVTNTTVAPPKGDLRITKAVTMDGNPTSTNLADGTYNFTITGPENYNHTASITVTGGVATSTIDLTDLTLGDYTITETGSTDGHATLSERAVTGTGSISGGNAIVLTVTASSTVGNTIAAFTNNVNTGTATSYDSVTVNKKDESNSALTGAIFTLYSDSACQTQIRTYGGTDVSSFQISTQDAELASYLPTANGGSVTLYLKETTAPTGYVLSDTIHNVVISTAISGPTYDSTAKKWVTTTTYTMTIDEAETKDIPNNPDTDTARVDTSVTVYKLDDKGTALPGATFTLYDGETVVKTFGGEGISQFTINTSDTDLASLLPAVGASKTLTLKETAAPAGYILNTTAEYSVVISASAATAWNTEHTKLVTTTTYTILIDNAETKDIPNTPQTGSVTFTQKKTFANGNQATAFGYTITEYTDNTYKTVKSVITNSGSMSGATDGVTAVDYTLSDIGNHYYIVKENLPEGTTPTDTDIANQYVIVGGVKYDLREYRYTVNVAVGTDALVVTKDSTTVTNIDSSFTNEQLGNLQLSKTTDPADRTQTFTFTIQFSGTNVDDVKGKTFPAEGTAGIASVSVDDDGKATVTLTGGQNVTIKNLPVGVTYAITEDSVTGWTNTVKTNGTGTIPAGTAQASFTNKYTEITGAPQVQKTLSGRDWVSDDTFTFTMAPDTYTNIAITDGKVVMPGTLTVEAKSVTAVSFQNITFKEAGTYYFKITEDASSPITGITYSQKEVMAKAEVTKDTSTGAMTVTWTYTDVKDDAGTEVTEGYASTTKVFTNTYTTEETAQIKGTKAVTNGGNDLSGYSFTLAGVDGAPVPDNATATSAADGSFSFDAITYTMAQAKTGTLSGGVYTKIYTYHVTENLPAGADPATDAERTAHYAIRNGIKYDLSEKTVTVTVTYTEATGEMVASVAYDPATFTFTNEQLGSLKIVKEVTVNGEAVTDHNATSPADGNYIFGVYSDEVCNTQVGSDVTITITNGQSNTAEVPNLSQGTYYVKEKSSDNPAMTLDTTAHRVTVTAGQSGTTVDPAGIATIINNYPGTTVPVKKIWTGGTVPSFVASVEISLYTNEECTTAATHIDGTTVAALVLNSGNSWTGTFTNLPEKDSSGNTITYSIKETKVNYVANTATLGGTNVTALTGTDIAKMFGAAVGTTTENETTYKTITNTYETTPITIAKAWTGNEWPSDVTAVVMTLKANGATASVTAANNTNDAAVTLDSATQTATWTNLPVKDVDGNTITYTVEETSVTMNNVTYTGSDLTNMFTVTTSPATVTNGQATITNTKHTGQIVVTKTVQLNGVADSEAAGKVFWVAVYSDADAQHQVGAAQSITIGSEGSGTATFTGLLPGTYYVYELTAEYGEPVTGNSVTIGDVAYTVTTSQTDTTLTIADLEGSASIINNKTEKGSLTVNKVTLYNEQPDAAVSGKKIKIGLYQSDGTTPVTDPNDSTKAWVQEITLGANGDGNVTFSELEYGTYYAYELDDSNNPVTGTSGTINGVVYTVSRDATNKTLAHGTDTQNGTINITNSTAESGSLAVTKEITVNGAASTLSGIFKVALYKVTTTDNNGTLETTETIVGTPETITVTNGVSDTVTFSGLEIGATYCVYEVTVDESNNVTKVGDQYGQYTVTYTQQEVTIPRGVGKDMTGTKVTNNIQTTTVTVDKKWYNGSTEITSTITNASITVQLRADGAAVTEDASGATIADVTLDGTTDDVETTAWTYTWDNLPMYNASGALIAYTVVETSAKMETNVGTGTALTPTAATGDMATGFHLENTLPTTERHATKTWNDNSNTSSLRPERITFTLSATANNTALTTTEMTELGIMTEQTIMPDASTGDWPTADWTGLPQYTNAGALITYDAGETAVSNYTQTGKEWNSGTNTWTFTNTLGETTKEITATKSMKGGENVTGTFSFTLTADTDTPMPSGATTSGTTQTLTVQNTANVITFGTITYRLTDMNDATQVAGEGNENKKEKTFTYTMAEVDESNTLDNIHYDPAVYTVSVTVTYDSSDGTLTAGTPTYSKEVGGETTTPDAITFENEEVITVTVTKAWSPNAPTDGTTIVLGLYNVTDLDHALSTITLNGTPDAAVADETHEVYPTGNTTTNYEDTEWHAAWTNLAKYDGGAAITYVAKETTGASGYTVSYNNGANEYVLNNGTITNTLNETSLKIVKEDGTTHTHLTGAQFRLEKQNAGETYETVAAYASITVSSVDGVILTGLTDGSYQLVETQAPSGYNMLSGAITFTISNGVVNRPTGDTVTYIAAVADDPTTTDVNEASPATFTIPNTPGVELPATGGSGTILYTASGLTLLLGAALWLFLRRRREQNT